MNYYCTLLNSIHGFEMEIEEFELGVYDLKITTKNTLITDFFDAPTLNITGYSQIQNTKKLKTFVYNQFEIPKTELNEKSLLAYLLKTCAILSNALWMVKDSSVRFETGHLKYTDNIVLTIHSNALNGLYFTSIGEKTTTSFSEQEINQAKEYFEFFFNLTLKEEANEPENSHAEVNRINRAYYFIDLARINFDIGTKVSLYCSAFECLFSVSNGELRHRLSETIANFLETEFELKKDIYNKVKAIYDLRSSVTHGSGIRKKLITNDAAKLKELGQNCDEILRRCLDKIIVDQELVNIYLENENKSIAEYFMDLNFK